MTFDIHLSYGASKSLFLVPRIFTANVATSLLRKTRGFLKSSFYLFPYDEILEVFESKI